MKPKSRSKPKTAKAETPVSRHIYITESLASGIVTSVETGRRDETCDPYAFINCRTAANFSYDLMEGKLPIDPREAHLFQPGMILKIRVQLFDK
jgi:hypothetical protein